MEEKKNDWKKFKFEIQNCITIEEEGYSAEDARMKVINNLDDYADEMVDGSCYVSNGEEVSPSETG